MKRRIFRSIILALVAVLLVAVLVLFFQYADNTTLQLTTYQISHKKIPAQFQGYRIVQIADLHNAQFGENNADLLALLEESNPDIIVFTGDQLDARKTDKDVVVSLVRQAVQIAPCYLVTGNHEGSIPDLNPFHTELEALGVVVLRDEIIQLSREDAVIELIGLQAPTMKRDFYIYGPKDTLDMTLQRLEWDQDHYSILLAHHPEFLYVYERNGVDLAICGHVHGGQVRINGRGLIGPSKELFPEYHSGVYQLKDATMVLSRGLGNSIFPWRINNPPEIVVVELIANG